jgi:hypothetical protein
MRVAKTWIALGILAASGLAMPGISRAEEAGEPAAEASAEEGTEPVADTPAAGEASEAVTGVHKRRWGVGLRMRYVFLPKGVLELFLDHATSMSSVGFGAEVVTRKGDFDVVFGFEYEGIAADNGLYLEKGDDPRSTTDGPDLVEFDGLALLAFDASFIWHAKLSSKVHLRYGGGIGLGFVLGDVLQTDYICLSGQLDDPTQCTPQPGGKNRVPSEDVPPVVPIINFLLGARFNVSEQISLNVEGGFRDVFYLGVGTNYIF